MNTPNPNPEIQPKSLFTFSGHNVRTYTIAGDPWFAAKDVCAAVGIKWSGNSGSLANIPDRWKKTLNWLMTTMGLELSAPGGLELSSPPLGLGFARGGLELPDHQGLILINEPALYKLVFRSNKPQAEAFTDWVAEVVLPALRKTGTFSLDSELGGQANAALKHARKRCWLLAQVQAMDAVVPVDYHTISEYLSAHPEVDRAAIRPAIARLYSRFVPVRAWNVRRGNIITHWPIEALNTLLPALTHQQALPLSGI